MPSLPASVRECPQGGLLLPDVPAANDCAASLSTSMEEFRARLRSSCEYPDPANVRDCDAWGRASEG